MNTLKLAAIILISLYLIFLYDNTETYITGGNKNMKRRQKTRLFRKDIRTLGLQKHFEDVDAEVIKTFLERLRSDGNTVRKLLNNINFKDDEEREHVQRLLYSLLDSKVSINPIYE